MNKKTPIFWEDIENGIIMFLKIIFAIFILWFVSVGLIWSLGFIDIYKQKINYEELRYACKMSLDDLQKYGLLRVSADNHYDYEVLLGEKNLTESEELEVEKKHRNCLEKSIDDFNREQAIRNN